MYTEYRMDGDINFDCPKCGQNLEAPRDMAGLFVECPTCAAIIRVPTPTERVSSVVADSGPSEKPTFVAPPPGPEDKSSTMRIDLPPEYRLPPPPPRRLIIRRQGGSR